MKVKHVPRSRNNQRSNSGKRDIRPHNRTGSFISFFLEPGRSHVEVIHSPEEGLRFAIKKNGRIEYKKSFSGYQPLSWLTEYVAVGGVKLPSVAEPYGCFNDLATSARKFVHRYFDCPAHVEAVLVLYALHTWVKDKFHAVPYFRFLGIPGSGKTRGTETLAALCYRSTMLAGNQSSASVYRMMDAVSGTLVLDEADFVLSQIGSDMAKILNCGYQKNMPITRMEKDSKGVFVPTPYDPFGPKVLNGRRKFRDCATETRCLVYIAQPTSRNEIPKQLPSAFEEEAIHIRNMALQWRFDTLEKLQPREIRLPGKNPRSNQILMPLVQIAEMLTGNGLEEYRRALNKFGEEMEEQAKEEQMETVEAKLVAAYVALVSVGQPICIELVRRVLDKDNGHDPSLRNWLTPKTASTILRSMGFETKHVNKGAEVSITPNRLGPLCERFGIEVPFLEQDQNDKAA